MKTWRWMRWIVLLSAFSLVVLLRLSGWTSESNVAASSVEREVDYRNLKAIFSEIEKDLNDNKQVDKFGNKLTTLEVLAKRYEESATAGDRAAQFKLGAMNLEGLGVDTNYGDALRWFTKAGGRDHPLAQLAFGLFSLECGEDNRRDDRFRESAIRALGEIGPGAEAAVPLLKREMYSDGRFNSIAAESLGQIVAPGVSVLIEALGEKDARLRYSAMSGLMRAGQAAKPASSALNDQLQDPNEKIRKEAARVLKMLGSQEQKQ